MAKSRAKMNNQERDRVFLALDTMNEFDEDTQKTVNFPNNRSFCTALEEEKRTEQSANIKAPRFEEFDRLLLESIDEALASLGDAVKNSIYQHLQNDFGIKKSEIPTEIFDFSDIMHKIFGPGATPLEIKFMMNLNSKIKIEVNWPEINGPCSKWLVTDMSFTEYVNNMRENYADVKKSGK
jgi:hypothetical protein